MQDSQGWALILTGYYGMKTTCSRVRGNKRSDSLERQTLWGMGLLGVAA